MERLPGFRDFYPEPLPHKDVWSADGRQFIFTRWREAARRYAFREYDGPPLEPLELYTLKSGDEIVGQLYNFSDKGSREVALRPEMTPTLARMVAAHERNYRKPIKWFAIPQLFRYERQQKGRLREHFQLNADIVGESGPDVDAELIALLIDSLRAVGLGHEDFVVRLSSRTAWQGFFRARCSDETKAYEFYQIVDKLERDEPAESARKLNALGLSLEDVSAFIKSGEPAQELRAVIDNLVARGLGEFVKLDYNVIRGLAYYTGVVFEAFSRKGDFRAIAGGGRYDNLVKLISGGRVDLPCVGFGMGDVVLGELLKARRARSAVAAATDVFVLVEDEQLRGESLRLVQTLRDAALVVELALTPMKPDKQFKRALDLKVAWTVRLARTETGELVAKVKNLAARSEQSVSIEQVASIVKAGSG